MIDVEDKMPLDEALAYASAKVAASMKTVVTRGILERALAKGGSATYGEIPDGLSKFIGDCIGATIDAVAAAIVVETRLLLAQSVGTPPSASPDGN